MVQVLCSFTFCAKLEFVAPSRWKNGIGIGKMKENIRRVLEIQWDLVRKKKETIYMASNCTVRAGHNKNKRHLAELE